MSCEAVDSTSVERRPRETTATSPALRRKKPRWTPAEKQLLFDAAERHALGGSNVSWTRVAAEIPGKSACSCMKTHKRIQAEAKA